MAREIVEYDPATQGAISRFFSNSYSSIKDALPEGAQQVLEKAEVVVDSAKEKLQAPFATVERVVNKAIPAAIAACASLQYTGGQGSFANFLQPITLRTKYFYLDGSRAAFIGRPLNNTRVLSTLTGFVQCENVKLELSNATIYEQQLVKSYLEKGCYIE